MPAAAGIQVRFQDSGGVHRTPETGDDGALVALLTRDDNPLPQASQNIGTPFLFCRGHRPCNLLRANGVS
jgi:hypothetical protein